jgi:hypothetical protein
MRVREQQTKEEDMRKANLGWALLAASTILGSISPASAAVSVPIGSDTHFDTESTVVWIGTATDSSLPAGQRINQYACASRSDGYNHAFLMTTGNALSDNVTVTTGTGNDTHYFVQTGFVPTGSAACGLTSWGPTSFGTFFVWSQSGSGTNTWYGPAGAPSYFLVGSFNIDNMYLYASTGAITMGSGTDTTYSYYSSSSSEAYGGGADADYICDQSGTWGGTSSCGAGVGDTSDIDNQTAGTHIADCDIHNTSSC